MRTTILLIILHAFSSVAIASDDKTRANARLSEVTVYRLGAEMKQTFKAAVNRQTQYVEVLNVSNAIEKNSLQIKTSENITILGFEFYKTFTEEEQKTLGYRRVEDSLQAVERKTERLKSAQATLKDLLHVLSANRDIKGTVNGLSVAELIKLMDYYKKKSNELKTEISALDDHIEEQVRISEKLKKQLDEEKKKNTENGGRLLIQVSCNVPGAYDFTISYLTQNALWTPFYDARVTDVHSPFNLVYKAKVSQTTGIDWKQVRLKLSTALPDRFGNAPILKTWFLQYVQPKSGLQIRGVSSLLEEQVAGTSLEEVVVVGLGTRNNGSFERQPAPEPIYVVNGTIIPKSEYKKITPQAIKNVEVLKDAAATAIYGSRAAGGAVVVTLKDELSDYVTVEDNSVSTVYDIDIPFDIPTNGKEQVAVLQNNPVKALYTFYAIPKLSETVFLLARVPEWGKLNLLDGDANLFYENTYEGRSFINTSSVSDTLDLTIAMDKRIFTKREKLKDFSSTKLFSNDKKETFTYEITVKNTKNETANMIVKDQFPISSNKEIEVELTEHANAKVNKETGSLEWEFALKPSEQRKIRFQYTVRYPKHANLNL